MASDPVIRQAMLEELVARSGSVRGSTFGEVVDQLAPPDVSRTQAKSALNSLAHTTVRPRSVVISRERPERGTVGMIVVSPLRR